MKIVPPKFSPSVPKPVHPKPVNTPKKRQVVKRAQNVGGDSGVDVGKGKEGGDSGDSSEKEDEVVVEVEEGQGGDEGEGTGEETVKEEEKEEEEEVNIPVAMISKDDGDSLIATLAKRQRKASSSTTTTSFPTSHPRSVFQPTNTKVTISTSPVHVMLDNDVMGYYEYPKIRFRHDLIHVLGRGRW